MPIKLVVNHPERCMGCMTCVLVCSREIYGSLSVKYSAMRVFRDGLGFRVVVCSGCEDPDCASACPYEALKPRPDGGVELVNPDKCVECEDRPCLDACSMKALRWDDERKRPIVCIECGVCAKFCPHEVLYYGEVV